VGSYLFPGSRRGDENARADRATRSATGEAATVFVLVRGHSAQNAVDRLNDVRTLVKLQALRPFAHCGIVDL
jgi:hypothetical protein